LITRIKKLSEILITGLMLVSLVVPSAALAQPGSGIQISPTRHELNVEPGQKKSVIITIKNVTSGPITAIANINDFKADNLTGEPNLIGNDEEPSPNSIKKFISAISDIDLAINQSKDITLEINVPANTPPGAYYGIVRYQAVPQGQSLEPGQVLLSASVGTIILLEVPGEVTQSMKLLSLKAAREDKSGSWFISAPDKVLVEIKNTGNTFIRPFGRVSISRSGQEVFSYDLNNTIQRGNVLPDSTRRFSDDIKGINKFGKYKVTANIGVDEGGEVSTISASFWYIPLWLMGAIAGILIVLGLVIWLVWRKISRGTRRYRR
jgi:hypothetical protein